MAAGSRNETTEKVLVNGIFRGGGARGVAYAGALKAVERSGMWFASVAGASAGAITAALIAAGLTADELEAETTAALSSVKGGLPGRVARMVVGHRHAFYDSDKLRDWLAARLIQAVRTHGGGDVTFADVQRETGIELFVVTMDLATGSPIVFQHERTPDVAVADAVVASCAIPMAFPARRAMVADPERRGRVHQLVDGGAWANYPSFVYDDESFAAWLGGDEAATAARSDRETLGFVLGEVPDHGDGRAIGFVSGRVSRRFDRGSSLTATSPVTFGIGSVLASDWARGFLAVATVVWALLTVSFWPEASRELEHWLRFLPDGLEPLASFLLGGVLVLSAAIVFMAALLVLAISRIVAETGLPSAQAALGVATGVAPWVGAGADDHVLEVPDNGIGTTEFGVESDKAAGAVDLAEARALEQLRGFDRLIGRLGIEIPDTPEVVAASEAQRPRADRPIWWSLASSFAIAALVAVLGWAVLTWVVDLDTGWQRLLAVVAPVVVVLIVGAMFAKAMARTASARADRWVPAGTAHPTSDRTTWIVGALGVLALVAGPAIGAWRYEDRDDGLARVEIVAAERTTDGDRYDFEGELLDGGTVTGSFVGDDQLRLGQSVLLSESTDGTWTVTRSTSEGWSVLAIAVTVFGIGALTSAVKRRSWLGRDARLGRLLDGHRPSARPRDPAVDAGVGGPV